MDPEQDQTIGFSELSLAESRNAPNATTHDSITQKETDSIVKGMLKCTQIDYKWMDSQRSTYYELGEFERADKVTKRMNALLSEEKEDWDNQQTAASNTAKSLKRPRSSENGRETNQDVFVKNAEADVDDAATSADTIFTSFKRNKPTE